MWFSATGCEDALIFDLALGGIIAVLLLAYLIYALVRPERF